MRRDNKLIETMNVSGQMSYMNKQCTLCFTFTVFQSFVFFSLALSFSLCFPMGKLVCIIIRRWAISLGRQIINGGVRKWICQILFTVSMHEYQIGTSKNCVKNSRHKCWRERKKKLTRSRNSQQNWLLPKLMGKEICLWLLLILIADSSKMELKTDYFPIHPWNHAIFSRYFFVSLIQ